MEQKKFEFSRLEIKEKKRDIKDLILSKTLLFVIIGAIISSTYYYFNEWQHFTSIGIKDIVEGVSVGSIIGYFIATSPCTNNKC